MKPVKMRRPLPARLADRELDRKDLPVLGDGLHEAAVADDPRLAGPQIVVHVGIVLVPIGLRA